MSTKQPLNKNRFKGLSIPWRKNLHKILGKSEMDNVDDRQSIISDLKRDNILFTDDKYNIKCFFDDPFGIDTYKKIVNDYQRGCNSGSNQSDDILCRSLQRGELVNLQKCTMRKQLPNETDSNYIQYQLTINKKYTDNKLLIDPNQQQLQLSTNRDQLLSCVDNSHDTEKAYNEDFKTWSDSLGNLKNQLQMQYEDEWGEESACYNEEFSQEVEDNNSFHSAPQQEDQISNNDNQNKKDIQMNHYCPATITLNWNNCKVFPLGNDEYPDPGDSSQSFNQTLKNILCEDDSTLKTNLNPGMSFTEDKNGKFYFTNKVLPEMVLSNKPTKIRLSTDSSHQTSPNLSQGKIENASPTKYQNDEQQILREELHRVHGEINQLKSLCSTFAKNMANLSSFQEEIKLLFERKFPDPNPHK